ncbi:sensor histidine kinase [Pseudoroseomonas cervicalis]|uniref:sensor histidine kinase n=1 Tax=Teichococcus cervicalis TaxID=204525 RepID=UPI0027837229|nr:sensor histidine kinase [Pseudoroseomonas cervicalis]MDQ1080523.1 two-component sensor histidine kinase [Pseudoroseomonas cervicalis]
MALPRVLPLLLPSLLLPSLLALALPAAGAALPAPEHDPAGETALAGPPLAEAVILPVLERAAEALAEAAPGKGKPVESGGPGLATALASMVTPAAATAPLPAPAPAPAPALPAAARPDPAPPALPAPAPAAEIAAGPPSGLAGPALPDPTAPPWHPSRLALTAAMALSLSTILALALARWTRQGRAAQQRLARALAEREAERRLTDIAANLPGALYRLVRSPCGRLSCTYISEGINTLLGEPSGSSARHSLLRALTPETRARAEAALLHSATTLTPLALEGDVRTADGRRLWLRSMASVHPLPDGSVVWDGVLLDSTEHRLAEERAALLAREVDHRAKNIMAVVRSLLLLTPRDVPPAQFVANLDGRLCAMARAHDLLAGGGWAGAELAAVVRRELATYDAVESGPRLVWQGPPVKLATGSVQPVEMILHELSTNAAKHGALSRSGGVVELRWAAAPQGGLTLDWRESGGPAISGEPGRHGFGFRLIHTLARHQLGGGATFLWSEEGLQCRIRLGPASVAAIEAMAEAPCDTPLDIPEPPARQAV